MPFPTISWSQLILGGAFILMGVLHFVVPKPFVSIMPRFLPRSLDLPLVYISGVFEFLGGAGVLLPAVRSWAGVGLLLLLLAVYPANIQMLISAYRTKASALALAALWGRLPLQFVMMWWVWKSTLTSASL